MKVLQIVADGTPGGGTTNVLALTEDLMGLGIDVVFCSEADSYATHTAKSLGAEVVEGVEFFRGRLNRTVVSELQLAFNRLQPDIVHCHGARAALAWVRGSDKQQLSRSLYTVRGYHFWRKPLIVRGLAMRAERWISSSVYRTIYVAKSDQDSGLQHRLIRDLNKSQVIRNGIRLSDMPSLTSDLSTKRKVVAVLGRITKQKNPGLVLDIAKELIEDGFEFHFIGGGDLEQETMQRAKDANITNVRFFGNQSRADAMKLMLNCGTFLLASLWEGLPIAPVEAMAIGQAVVISDVNGNTEVVRPDLDGRVVPSNDLAGFVVALRSVVAEPSVTERMIASGRDRVVTEFSRERVTAENLKLYQQCLSEEPCAT